MSRDLLLEIGSEEIPAKFLARALADLPAQVTARLAAARLSHGDVRALGTPRRIAVIVRDLAGAQPDLRERVFGPPVAAAFAADGTPTKAAIGFAQKNGVDAAALERAEQPGKKGLYAVAERFVRGEPTPQLLPEILGDVIRGIAWPKSMRWGWGQDAFVRPIHWLVALYGDDVVPLDAYVRAGRATRGHRFLHPQRIDLASPAAYVEALRAGFVLVDIAERRDLVRAELTRIETETGLRVRRDDALVDEVTNLAEWPVAVVGGFDPSYLDVPEEVIVTAMRTHQRYFALEDAAGKLAPKFVAIAGTIVRDPAVVRAGNERVLAARLSDAKFFFTEDQKKPLADHAKKLDAIVFQAKLGDAAKTIGHKVRRLEGFVGALADAGVRCDRDAALAAAGLCKADLATGIVGEFPELQGVMGMHYARRQSRGDAVATAIAEHYLPRGQGSGLPTTVEGALIALADRMDTLVGCFATGLEPSGSADPYGLRRAAIGVLQILFDRGPGGPRFAAGTGWPLSLRRMIDVASAQFAGTLDVTGAAAKLDEFFRSRLRGMLIDEGLAVLDVEAALGAGFDDPCDARLRARDLAVVPAPAREVFKRIANILDDASAKGIAVEGSVSEGTFVADAERRLWSELARMRDRIDTAVGGQRYRDLFGVLVELQPTVAAFFDKGGVMVMDPDPALRDNRLHLLHNVLRPFARVADFRLLAGQAS
jgi:glycyl-tRNA synthetase beta chain